MTEVSGGIPSVGGYVNCASLRWKKRDEKKKTINNKTLTGNERPEEKSEKDVGRRKTISTKITNSTAILV